MCEREREGGRAERESARKRGRECVCVRERKIVCVCERERECVCEREKERECVCERERETCSSSMTLASMASQCGRESV